MCVHQWAMTARAHMVRTGSTLQDSNLGLPGGSQVLLPTGTKEGQGSKAKHLSLSCSCLNVMQNTIVWGQEMYQGVVKE
jgi:hypothetical protein